MPIEDPNTLSGGHSLCIMAGKLFGKIPLGSELVSVICSRAEARQNYLKIRPLLLQELGQETPSEELVLYLAAKLMQTAEFGACRANFRYFFIDGQKRGKIENVDLARVRKLPKDPRRIMFGIWGSYF